MSVFSIPPMVMAGIAFYVGVYHLMIYLRRRLHRENLTFALMCFVVGFYDVFSAGLYNAHSAAEGFPWQRAQVIALALASVTFIWFVNDYFSRKPTRWIFAYSAIFLLAAVGGLANRPGIFWLMDQPAIKEIQLPFNLAITYYEMTPGPITNIQSVAGISVFVYALAIGVHFYRRGQRTKARWLLLTIVLLFIGVFNDTAVSSKLYQFVYIIEYSYMAMVFLMAHSLSELVVQAAVVQDALRESEERYRSLVSASADGIVLTDLAAFLGCSVRVVSYRT